MSHPRSKPIAFGHTYTEPDDSLSFLHGLSPSIHSIDHAIDAALRSVPLPDGLLTRLGRLVDSMSDEAADRIDYLGC